MHALRRRQVYECIQGYVCACVCMCMLEIGLRVACCVQRTTQRWGAKEDPKKKEKEHDSMTKGCTGENLVRGD